MHFQVIFHSAEFFYIKRRIVGKIYFSMLKYILKLTLRKIVKTEEIRPASEYDFWSVGALLKPEK